MNPEVWGCRFDQKLHCFFFLCWSNKNEKVLISGGKKGCWRVYSAWGIWWIKRGRRCKYSSCVCVFLPEWAWGGRGGLRGWLSSARLVEGFLVWYCLTVTSKASCFDLVTVECCCFESLWVPFIISLPMLSKRNNVVCFKLMAVHSLLKWLRVFSCVGSL